MIVIPIVLIIMILSALLGAVLFVTPVQKSIIHIAIRVFDIPMTVDFDRLRLGLNFLNVDDLELTLAGDSRDITIELDSIRTNFNYRIRELYSCVIYNPAIIIEQDDRGGKDSGGLPDFDIQDFQINRLRIINGLFRMKQFEINDIGYRGSLTSAGNGINVQPDSLGAYLVGRGRIVETTGDIRLADGVDIDVYVKTARSEISGKGSIIQVNPIKWNFAVEGDPADLAEVDSLLGLGFLEGYGHAKIDLKGYGKEVSGYVFIDGEIFTIPAKNASGQLDFGNNRLEISDLHGSAWGATIDGNLKMFFPAEDTSTEPIEMIIEGYARNFNISAFMDDGVLPTDLNGQARVVGEIRDTTATMTIYGNLGRSEIFDIAFDTASGSLYVSPDSVNFYPGFEVLRAGNYLTLNGVIVFDKEVFLQFGLWAPNLANLTAIAGMESTITGRARVEEAEFFGNMDSLNLTFNFVSDQLVTGPVEHDRFIASATLYDILDFLRGSIDIRSKGKFAGVSFDSLITQIKPYGNRYYVKPFLLWGDSISAKGVAEIAVGEDSIGIGAEGFDLELYDHPVYLESTFVVSILGDTIKSSKVFANVFGGNIIINQLVGDQDNITINAKLQKLSAQKASDLLPFQNVMGELSGEVFMRMPYSFEGAMGRYEMHLKDLVLNDLEFTRAEVQGDIHNGLVNVKPLVIGRETERYFLRGWIDPSVEGVPFDFEAKVEGTRADLLASFVEEIDSVVGPFDMKMNVKGSKDTLYADGNFLWENGVVGLKSLADPVESLYLELKLTGDELIIDSLGGAIGALPVEEKSLWGRIVGFFKKEEKRYGHFHAGGKIDISNPNSPDMDLKLTTNDLPLNFPAQGLFLRNTSNLTISGKQPMIEGRIKINRANLVQLETGGGNGEIAIDSLPIELNVLLDIPGNAWIMTDILESEIGGTVNIMTERGELALYGELEVLRGKAFFLGRTFRIQQGRVYFESVEGINPRLDIQAISHAGEVDIVLDITGDVSEPQINLYAQDRAGNRIPAYSQSDIFSLLALNVDEENIQTEVLEERVPQVIQNYLSREVEEVARKTLGVETFEFEPSEQDVFDLSQAKVTIGKYLTDKLYLTYTRSLSFDEATSDIINLEYRLSDHITIQAGREASGDETRDEYKLELQFKWEY